METITIVAGKNKESYTLLVDKEDAHLLRKYRWYINTHRGNYAYHLSNKSETKSPTIYLHRVIVGAAKGQYVDHINGNTLDNRKCNLRIVTNQENCQNLLNSRKNNSSGYRGVSFNKTYGKYEAYYWKNYTKYTVGYYDTAEEANTQVVAARKTHLPFSNENYFQYNENKA